MKVFNVLDTDGDKYLEKEELQDRIKGRPHFVHDGLRRNLKTVFRFPFLE